MKVEEIKDILDSDLSDSQKVGNIATGLALDFERKRIPLTKCVHFQHDKIPRAVKVFSTVELGQEYFVSSGYQSAINNGFVKEADCWAEAGMDNTAETLLLLEKVFDFFEGKRLANQLDEHQLDNYEPFLADALGSIALMMETEYNKVLLDYVRKNIEHFDF